MMRAAWVCAGLGLVLMACPKAESPSGSEPTECEAAPGDWLSWVIRTKEGARALSEMPEGWVALYRREYSTAVRSFGEGAGSGPVDRLGLSQAHRGLAALYGRLARVQARALLDYFEARKALGATRLGSEGGLAAIAAMVTSTQAAARADGPSEFFGVGAVDCSASAAESDRRTSPAVGLRSGARMPCRGKTVGSAEAVGDSPRHLRARDLRADGDGRRGVARVRSHAGGSNVGARFGTRRGEDRGPRHARRGQTLRSDGLVGSRRDEPPVRGFAFPRPGDGRPEGLRVLWRARRAARRGPVGSGPGPGGGGRRKRGRRTCPRMCR